MAVTYYNQTVLGGTSAPRYSDPLVTGAPSADGLYPWSCFRARFATYANGVVSAAEDLATGDGQVNLLLFTSDIPATGYIAPAATGAPAVPVAPAASVGVAGNPAFFRSTPGGSNVAVAAGQVGLGYSYNSAATTTANQNIYISGFPAVAAAVTATNPELYVWANSATLASPVSFENWDTVTADTATASGFLPIVLYYTSYTQAIRDAGNVIVNTAAPVGVIYQVVGLYSVGVANPA